MLLLWCLWTIGISREVKFTSEHSHERVKSGNAWQSRERAAINASRYIRLDISAHDFSVPESRDASCATYRWRRETNGLRASRRLHPKSVRDLARSTGLGTRLTFPIEKGRLGGPSWRRNTLTYKGPPLVFEPSHGDCPTASNSSCIRYSEIIEFRIISLCGEIAGPKQRLNVGETAKLTFRM